MQLNLQVLSHLFYCHFWALEASMHQQKYTDVNQVKNVFQEFINYCNFSFYHYKMNLSPDYLQICIISHYSPILHVYLIT